MDANSNIALNNIYEGLYRLDKYNQPIPAGADALPEISSDGLSYTIKLRKEAKWSNGEPVIATDYVYAWKRAIGAKNAAENSYLYTSILNADEILSGKISANELGVSALDDETLVIQLNKPTPYFTSMLAIPAFFPLKESFVMKAGDSFASDSEQAIYNGPFVMTGFKGPGIGSNWTYKKNREYWDQKAVKIETLNVEVVKETATNVNLFENGETDEISITGEYAKNKLADPAFVAEKPAQTIFLGYNQTKKLYQNKKIRQAISLLVDREIIAEQVLGNGIKPATGLIFNGLYTNPETNEDFTKASGNHLKTDVDKAKKLWLEGKKEVGLAEEAEVPIQLITFENEDMRKVSEYLQGLLADNLKGAKLTPSVYPVSVFMKNASNQEFDLYLVSWGADYPDPSSLLQLFRSDVAYNWGKYQSETYDNILKQADTTDVLNTEKRWEDLLQAEKTIMDDQGITPIYFSAPTYLRNPKLKEVIFHSVGPRFEYKYMYLEE
ncbi:peptide ABC transporter substrate-binding protein [Enterococcus rivorum]|uniref:peptide ABC transporter substrate-binding protein n=1 Tax=Enterococcus rivorum TaxID=762845 RepID=UPI00362A5FD2